VYLKESHAVNDHSPWLRGVIERLAGSDLGESAWRKLPADDPVKARLLAEWAIYYAIPDVLVALRTRPFPLDRKILSKIMQRHGEALSDVSSILGLTEIAAFGIRDAAKLAMNPKVFPYITEHWAELWGDGDPGIDPEKLCDLLMQLAGFFQRLHAAYHEPIDTVPPIVRQGAERGDEHIYTVAMALTARKLYARPCYDAVADLVSAAFNLEKPIDADTAKKRVQEARRRRRLGENNSRFSG
jgi:hypothetical protein